MTKINTEMSGLFVNRILKSLWIIVLLLCVVIISKGSSYPSYLFGFIVGIPLALFIFFRPILAVYLLAILIPMEIFQVIPGLGLTGGKLITALLLLTLVVKKVSQNQSWKVPIIKVIPLIFLIGWIGITLALHSSDLSGYQGIFSMTLYLILIVLIVNVVHSEHEIIRVISILFYTIVVICILSLLGKAGVIENRSFAGQLHQEQLVGAYDDPNKFGLFILLVLPFFQILISQYKTSLFRYAIYLCLLILFSATLGTLSRSTWITLACLLFLYPILTRKYKTWLLGLIVLCSLALIFAGEISTRLNLGIHYTDMSISDRIVTNQAALSMIKDNPWFGVGLNHIIEELQPYKQLQGGYYTTTTNIHNIYLYLTTGTGIPGILLFLWFQWNLFQLIRWIKRNNNTWNIQFLTTGFFLSFTAFLILNLFVGFIYIALYWFIMGLCMALYQITLEKIKNPPVISFAKRS